MIFAMHHFRIVAIALVKPFITLLGIGGIAAMLAPDLWSLIDGHYPLEKVFVKTTLGLLVLTAILAVKCTPFTQSRGSSKSSIHAQLMSLLGGWFTGIFILSLPICLLLILKLRSVDTDALASVDMILHDLISAFSSGLLVGLVEEYIFRGWLMDWLQAKLKVLKSTGKFLAIIISAVDYSLIHFLKPATNPHNQSNTISAGLDVFLRSLIELPQQCYVDTLLALFLAGVLLGLVKLFCNNGLLLVIGIHAGWVFSIKAMKATTDPNLVKQWQYLVGQDGITGYLSAGWLGLLIVGLSYALLTKQREEAARE